MPIVIAILVFWASPAFADCQGITSLLDMEGKLALAELAYSQGETDKFKSNSVLALDMIPCLEHKITPDVAARMHLVIGTALASEQPTRAKLAFRAANHLDKNGKYSAWIPSNTPAAKLLKSAGMAVPQSVEVAPPISGKIRFDGAESYERPVTRPTVYQRVSSTGRSEDAAYVWPDDALPVYPIDKKVTRALKKKQKKEGK